MGYLTLNDLAHLALARGLHAYKGVRGWWQQGAWRMSDMGSLPRSG